MKKFFFLPCIFVFSLLLSLFLLACVAPSAFASDPDRTSGNNKSPGGATLVPLNGTDEKGKCSYDQGDRTDWYKIYVNQTGILEVIVQNRIEGNLELEAYGPEIRTAPDTPPLKASVTPASGNERVKFLVEQAVWYYLKVYAAQPGDEGDYAFFNQFYEPDRRAPQIIVPQSTWTTTEASLTVFGTIRDDSDIASVWMNTENILTATEILNQEFGEVRSFSYTLEDLAFGKNSIAISASDMSGNLSSPVEFVVIREDPPPTLLITAPEQNVRFQAPNLVVQGMATDNDEVSRVLINGKNITDEIEFIAKDQAIFSYRLSELQYGEQEIVVTAEDNQGQQSCQTLLLFRDAPPTIRIDFPQEHAEISGETVDIHGLVNDDGQVSRILINQKALSEHDIASIHDHDWEFTATVSGLQYGANTLTVTAIDDFDTQTTHQLVLYRIETPPAIRMITPLHEARISTDAILVKGYVQDHDGIQLATVNAIPVVVDSSGMFQHTLTDLALGSHDIVVAAQDTRGNQTQASVRITKVDESAPSISILAPADGKTIPGTETAVIIQGTVKDSNNRIKAIRINGQDIAASSIILPGTEGETRTFSSMVENLAIGDNTIVIQAEDQAGNLSPATQLHILRLDPPPKILVAAPQNETRFPAMQEIVLEGRVEDNDRVSHILVNDQNLSDQSVQDVATLEFLTPGQVVFRYALKDLEYGAHNLTIMAEDNLGNRSRQTLTFYRDAPPEILHIFPRSGERTWGDAIQIQGEIKDNQQVTQITINGIEVAEREPFFPEKQEDFQRFSYTVSDLKYGVNFIDIEAHDDVGNVAQERLEIFREEIPPRMTVISPRNQEQIAAEIVIVEGVASDADGIKSVTVNDVPVEVDAAGKFHSQLKGLPYGHNECVVTAIDSRDNTSILSLSIIKVDAVQPAITVLAPQQGVKIKENFIPIQVRIRDDDQIANIEINREKKGGTDTPGAERIFTYIVKDLQDGENRIPILAEDRSGNLAREIIHVYKVPPPKITVLGVSQGLYTTNDTFTITGQIQTLADIASLVIAGEEASFDRLNNNQFFYQVQDLQIGENPLSIQVRDSLDNENQEEITIIRLDKELPSISLLEPRDGFRTNAPEIVVKIRAHDNHRIQWIKIHDSLSGEAEFPGESDVSKTVPLDNGKNQIRIMVADPSDNIASHTLSVYRIPPPIITILPGDPEKAGTGMRTVDTSFVIKGYITTDDVLETVTIHGAAIAVDHAQNNSFSYRLEQLQPGENPVTITATDSLASTTQKEVVITRLDPDYQSGKDQTAEGANRLPFNHSVKDMTIDYAGDRTDWFKVFLDTTGTWSVTIVNELAGQLDVELYGPDQEIARGEVVSVENGRSTAAMQTDGEGWYYAKVTARVLGDTGRYMISNEFVEIDMEAPILTILQPEKEEVQIEGQQLVIAGIAEDNSAIREVFFEGANFLAEGESSIVQEKLLQFTYTLSGLQPGENVITVAAVDQAGNKSVHKEFHVTSIKKPSVLITETVPSLRTQKDESGNICLVQTESETLTIKGKVDSSQGIRTIEIEPGKKKIDMGETRNVPGPQSEQDFQENIQLEIGQNKIVIHVIDSLGYAAEYLLTAIRENPTDLSLYRPGELYAVIIGIGNYQNENIRDLKFAVNDAKAIYELLIDPNYGRIPENHIQLLLDHKATKKDIQFAIGKWLSEKASPEDTVLFYYAGHGAPDGNSFYWVTYDADMNSLYPSALSNSEIFDMLRRIQAGRMIGFLDACHSAATVNKLNGTRGISIDLYYDKSLGQDQVIISASDGTQLSVELEEFRHGIFTYYLLEGLQGKADSNADGLVDSDEIWNYVKDQVPEKSREKAGNMQTPVFEGRVRKGIPLTFNLPVILEKRELEQSPSQKN